MYRWLQRFSFLSLNTLNLWLLSLLSQPGSKEHLTRMTSKLPLVVILGETGSGKTKLSLELAKKFGAHIISADSMQIYKGLDVVTAKATVEERKVAPHYLIDEIDPNEKYTVVDFRNKALDIVSFKIFRINGSYFPLHNNQINKLLADNILPIIVGGTNYYIESLLWKILIDSPGTSVPQQSSLEVDKLLELSSLELHKILLEKDPNRANRLHPNDKRKILTSLEIFYRKGRKHSEIIQEQQTSEGGSVLGGPLRFENAIIFWMMCDQNVLAPRLDKRVDQMMEQGLINELLDFHKRYNEKRIQNDEVDYTKGVFQTIGFKEFHKYLMLTPEEQSSDDGKQSFKKGVDDLKRVTRNYAKKQKKWIINRLLNMNSNRQVPPVYGLDTTVVSKWGECVNAPAIAIVESYINGTECPHPPLPKRKSLSMPNSMAEKHFCNTCNRVFIGKLQWDCHVKSQKHKRAAEPKKSKAEN